MVQGSDLVKFNVKDVFEPGSTTHLISDGLILELSKVFFFIPIYIIIALYFCDWYKVYDNYQRQTPIIRGTLYF